MRDEFQKTREEVPQSLGSRLKGERSCNPKTQTKDELPPGLQSIQGAVSTDLILKCIFGHLRTADVVKGCRLVNRQWNRVAVEVLKKRTDAYVKVHAKTNFEALTACIRNSSDFPFREISLECDQKDFGKSPEEWLEVNLFHQYSTTFTRLRLTSSRLPDLVLCGFFSGPFTHIESLTLELIKRKKNRASRSTPLFQNNGNRLILENLKIMKMGRGSLCWDINSDFLEALLRCCPNLLVADNFTNAQLSTFFKVGKLGTVKSLQVCRCVMREDKKCPRPIGVEKLIIVRGLHQHASDSDDEGGIEGDEMEFAFLQPLLEANRETIRHIEVSCDVEGGKLANWPKLTRLTSLKLIRCCEFPDSVNEVFPALETIQFAAEEDCEWYSFAGRYLWEEPLSSVTKLELHSCLTPEDLACLVLAMPNIRCVFLDLEGYLEHLEGLSRSDEPEVVDIWRGISYLKQLQKLCISPIQLGRINVERFLTGIPESNSKRLRANPQWPVPDPDFVNGVLRDGGSVASLPDGVKELDLYFKLSDKARERDLKNDPPFSHVTLQYGLNMAPPDLKIRVMYDHRSKNANLIKEALSPLSNRVTFHHWNTNVGQ